MSQVRVAGLTMLAMIAFAGNSLLARLALKQSAMDAASFTTIRLIAGAVALWLVARTLRGRQSGGGSWTSALALYAYAACFSFAYVSLPTATGALLLFGAVQTTMIGHGVWAGERLLRPQLAGLLLALGGLVGLLLPGLSTPPPAGSLLMLTAGVAWGVYSLRGPGAGDPTVATAGNFLRAVPFAAAVSLLLRAGFAFETAGFWYAVASGALTSGLGYAVWYAVLPQWTATKAATVQLSVPVLAAAGGVALLGEAVTPRLVLASAAILGGIALVTQVKRPRQE